MLVVSLPLMIVLAVLLTSGASSSLTAAGEGKGVSVARAVAVHVEDWLSERHESMSIIAVQAAGHANGAATAALLAGIDTTYGDFTVIEVTDLTGRVVATSRPGITINPTGTDWFRTASSGQPALTSLVQH